MFQAVGTLSTVCRPRIGSTLLEPSGLMVAQGPEQGDSRIFRRNVSLTFSEWITTFRVE